MVWFDKKPIIALAPMADMTDSPFCRICREVAGVSPSFQGGGRGRSLSDPTLVLPLKREEKPFIIFREMVSSEAIVRDSAKTLKMCEFDEIERPIVLQIFGGNPAVMREAARIIVDKFHPDGIDINMGCPVPKITGKVAAGATLMKNHDIAVEIIKELKNEKLGAPISVKTRLGWSDPRDILEFAPKLETAGADAITIHGRTKTQGYSGKANWEMIGEAKKLVSIPIIANGDIKSREDILKCLEVTGADGVMIGRGALGNPWIFNYVQTYRKYRSTEDTDRPDLCELVEVVLRHAKYHLERYGEKSMVTFRKHLAWYFRGDKVKEIKEIKKLRNSLMKVGAIEELQNFLSSP